MALVHSNFIKKLIDLVSLLEARNKYNANSRWLVRGVLWRGDPRTYFRDFSTKKMFMYYKKYYGKVNVCDDSNIN